MLLRISVSLFDLVSVVFFVLRCCLRWVYLDRRSVPLSLHKSHNLEWSGWISVWRGFWSGMVAVVASRAACRERAVVTVVAAKSLRMYTL